MYGYIHRILKDFYIIARKHYKVDKDVYKNVKNMRKTKFN